MDDVRAWWYYPIEFPLTADGRGPATVGVDAVKVEYHVWDQLYNTHGEFDNLPDAVNEAMRLNSLRDIEMGWDIEMGKVMGDKKVSKWGRFKGWLFERPHHTNLEFLLVSVVLWALLLMAVFE